VPAPTPLQLRFRQVLARIAENFDDEGAWLVYADMLLQKGDPRGELIAAAHVHGNVEELAAKHGAALFGAAVADVLGDPFKLYWRHGVVFTVTVRVPASVAAETRGINRKRKAFMEKMVALLKQPVFQWVSRFKFEFDGFDGFTDDLLAGVRNQAQIRSLEVEAYKESGGERWPRDLPLRRYSFSALTGLEELVLSGRTTSLAHAASPLDLPALRSLTLCNDNFFGPDFSALARSTLPALESLAIETLGDGSHTDARSLAEFVAMKGMPALRRLSFIFCRFADEVLDALTGSPLLAQLTHLDLSHGTYDKARLERPELAHLRITR
jgi:uncharacterized protein (TIGR02996 family)